MRGFKRFFKINIHAFIFGLFGVLVLWGLHLLPVNQIFIDPFSEAIKQHDIMDITFSRFREHNDPKLLDKDIVIINNSITENGRLAKTLTLLSKLKVKAIGLDIVLDSLTSKLKPEDTLLSKAISSVGNIVLANTFQEKTEKTTGFSNIQPDSFYSKGKTVGHVNLATNDGFSVRAFEPFHEINGNKESAFSVQLAKMCYPDKLHFIENRKHAKEWINFRRLQPGFASMIYPINSDSATHYRMVEMNQLLADSNLYKENEFFRDKIVLIGYIGEDVRYLSMHDRYFTPLNEQYIGRSIPDMSGVVIHANILSMIRDNDYINDVPNYTLYLIMLFIFYFNYQIFTWIEFKFHRAGGVIIRLFQVCEFILLFFGAIYLLLNLNLKMALFMSATAIVLSFELFEIYKKRLEKGIDMFFAKLIEKIFAAID